MGAHARVFPVFESLPICRTITATAVFAVAFLFNAYSVAQNYPPYGPHIPKAHFDHAKRLHLTPPPPKLICPVLSSNCDDTRTAQSEWNTELLGSDSLDGRSAYQPLVVRQGDRYIAYMAHHAGCAINRLNLANEVNGTSIRCDRSPAPGLPAPHRRIPCLMHRLARRRRKPDGPRLQRR